MMEHRRQRIESWLQALRPLWEIQPFREPRPAWVDRWPALAADLEACPEDRIAAFNADADLALSWLAAYFPGLEELAAACDVPCTVVPRANGEGHWSKGIPGRKRAQIEAFAAATQSTGRTVLDWCGGKGHLGRLLAREWQVPVHTLEIDPDLCSDGQQLAARLGVQQDFVLADALAVETWPGPGQHAVALHACGELHRRLLVRGVQSGVARFDVAPCCHYRGVAAAYAAMAPGAGLVLKRDDLRLAVTETVTASPRLVRQRDKEMAWKLAFDDYRRDSAATAYQSFRSVPPPWFRGSFADFMIRLAQREGLSPPPVSWLSSGEAAGWRRQQRVMRYSAVRHAFRKALETWLVLDLALYLEAHGYRARLSRFCSRSLTPRNLLLSAERS